MLFSLVFLLADATYAISGAPMPSHIASTDREAEVIGVGSRVELPSEIASALLPYMKCVTERLNEEAAQGISSGNEFRAAQSKAVEACSPARALAASAARELLTATEKSEAERDLLIDRGLSAVEHMQDNVAEQLDAWQKDDSHAED